MPFAESTENTMPYHAMTCLVVKYRDIACHVTARWCHGIDYAGTSLLCWVALYKLHHTRARTHGASVGLARCARKLAAVRVLQFCAEQPVFGWLPFAAAVAVSRRVTQVAAMPTTK